MEGKSQTTAPRSNYRYPLPEDIRKKPKVVTDPHACPIVDIDQVTNFVPGYLAWVTGRLWEVYDEEDYVVNKFNLDEGKHTLLDLFGTSIQHPEDHVVQYFLRHQTYAN